MSAPVAQRRSPGRNVIGTELVECALDVRGSGINAGLYRDGHCDSGPGDSGKHTVCVEATPSFLAFSAAVGNPLHMPAMRYHFPGLNAGDKWCLCAERWTQAHAAGVCVRGRRDGRRDSKRPDSAAGSSLMASCSQADSPHTPCGRTHTPRRPPLN